MKFVVLKDSYRADNRLILDNFSDSHGDTVGALIETTRDFDPFSNELQIVGTTYSYQIRPKAIYTSAKGYFYKSGRNRVYLNDGEVILLKKFVNKVNSSEDN